MPASQDACQSRLAARNTHGCPRVHTITSRDDESRVQYQADGDGHVVPPKLGKPNPGVEAHDDGDQGQGPKRPYNTIQSRGAALARWLIQGLPDGQESPVEQHHPSFRQQAGAEGREFFPLGACWIAWGVRRRRPESHV